MGVRLVAMMLVGMLGAVPAFAAETADSAKPKVSAAAAPAKRGDPSAAECGWIGKRIIQLLSREDVVAAGEFRQFYVGFGCSEAHLGAAFGCAIEGANPGAADSCSARSDCIDLCWTSPTASPLDKSKPTPDPAKTADPAAKPAPAANGKPQAVPPQPPKKPDEKVLAPRGPYDKQ